MTNAKISIEVPCGSCHACCGGMHVVLQPERGDILDEYETEEITNPITKEKNIALKHGKDGNCIYLDKKGCTIHNRAPIICKEFDCRKFWQRLLEKTTRNQRIRIIKKGVINRKILRQGKKLLKTLPKENDNGTV